MKTFAKNFIYFLLILILGILASLGEVYPSQNSLTDTTLSNNKPNIIQLVTDGVPMESAGENDLVMEDKSLVKIENPFSSFDFIQYSNNLIKNISSDEIQITSSKGNFNIKPGSIDSVMLVDEKNITITSAGKTYDINVHENRKPQVNMKPLYNMSAEDIHILQLQQKPCYIVRISDDRIRQLDWKITGPVKYNITEKTDTSIVLEITMNMFMSKSSFETFQARTDKDRYVTGFTINIKDRYAPHRLSPMGVFYFTEW